MPQTPSITESTIIEYKEEVNIQQFKCGGKIHCSDMTSCEEAIFYINHCPNTKMDGDGDGKPCEDWCGH